MSAEHRIRHYVYGIAGDRSTLIPRESQMRGAWACEAKCSCGWETRTGGAVRTAVDREVAKHRRDVRYAAQNDRSGGAADSGADGSAGTVPTGTTTQEVEMSKSTTTKTNRRVGAKEAQMREQRAAEAAAKPEFDVDPRVAAAAIDGKAEPKQETAAKEPETATETAAPPVDLEKLLIVRIRDAKVGKVEALDAPSGKWFRLRVGGDKGKVVAYVSRQKRGLGVQYVGDPKRKSHPVRSETDLGAVVKRVEKAVAK